MSYKGPVELIGWLSFVMRTVDGSGVPVVADTAPIFNLLAADGTAMATTQVTTALPGYTGLYLVRYQIHPADGFASGSSYNAVVQWTISGSARSAEFTFNVT